MKYLILIIILASCTLQPDNDSIAESLLYAGTATRSEVVNIDQIKLLVIGDSISLGWAPYASMKTKNLVDWQRLTIGTNSTWPENARNTNYTLRNASKWLDDHPDIDTVIWNNGVWNATAMDHVPASGQDIRNYGTTIEQYESELIQIANIIKPRVSRVIFLTTTPMAPDHSEAYKIPLFNESADRVLPWLGVEVFDLHDLVKDNLGWHISPTDVHFNSFGNEYMSEWIVHEVLEIN